MLDDRAIDADVQVGSAKYPLHRRFVGGQTRKEYSFSLTKLPPQIGSREVAKRYRMRWEVRAASQGRCAPAGESPPEGTGQPLVA
jgi:hypothetical protein